VPAKRLTATLKVLTLVGRGQQCEVQRARELCANHQGIEQLARYITRPAIANERLSINREGNVVLKLKPVLSLSKGRRGATAQHISSSRRWNSCYGWRLWCPGQDCT
jgi:Putative transposase